MDNACAERLVQVIKVTERLLMEPQSCGRMCLAAPEGQDCLHHNSNSAISHTANIRLYKALSILKQQVQGNLSMPSRHCINMQTLIDPIS